MGLYSITTRADGTVLTGGGSTSDIFNVDHVNHVTHTAAPYVNSFESDVAEMQLETDPAPLGAISLSAALSDELRRLRFALHQVKSGINASVAPAHWYTPVTPGSALVLAAQGARLEQTVAQDVVSGINTTVQFNSIVYDRGAMAVTTAGISSGLRAPVDGIYSVGGALGFGADGMANDFRLMLFRDDDAIATDQYDTGATAAFKALNVNAVLKLTAGQIMRLKILQTTTLVRTTGVSNVLRPAFWMTLVGLV